MDVCSVSSVEGSKHVLVPVGCLTHNFDGGEVLGVKLDSGGVLRGLGYKLGFKLGSKLDC